jgi:uncharacterized protein (DUF1810 family)
MVSPRKDVDMLSQLSQEDYKNMVDAEAKLKECNFLTVLGRISTNEIAILLSADNIYTGGQDS